MSGKPIATGSALTMGFAVLLAGAGLATVTSEAAAQAEPKSAWNDPSRRICRRITPTPSRLTRRVCRTQMEWEQTSRDAADGFLEHQMDTRNPLVRTPSNPDPR